jgi:tetratricopeptide (TPR) repeat protein
MGRVCLMLLLVAGCAKKNTAPDPREERFDRRETYTFVDNEGTTASPELFKSAGALLDKGDVAGARKLYQLAVQREPERPAGYVGVAGCDLHENKLADAEKQYRKAESLDPRATSPKVGLGTVASLQGKHKEAAALYEQAVALDEKNADAHWGAALSYQELGDHARKSQHARRFIQLAPQSALVPRAREMLISR